MPFDIFMPHATDFYKTGHIRQYPEGTSFVYSNWTCRSDKHAQVLPDFDHKVVFFGLQGVCDWMLNQQWRRSFFNRPLSQVIRRIEKRMDGALGAGAVGLGPWTALHGLGYLPVKIKAVPEGSRVNVRVPVFTIQNTLNEFYWVTNYLETMLSAELWKQMTTATTAYEYRRLLTRFAQATGADPGFVPWQGHDFSMRGLSGISDATQSGAAHLTSFLGTDTISALDYVEEFYEGDETFIGGSVPATEHSVMCMDGEGSEIDTFRRLICELYPKGIVSIVSDTWDFWRVINEYARELREVILNRQPDATGNAKVVFRPDSGDPVKVLVGDPSEPFGSPAFKGAVECLWDIFGGTTNAKAYRTLDKHVGLIYGDSISLQRAQEILEGLKRKGFTSGNVVFGLGSYTYQYVTRDTFGTAIKATFGRVKGQDRAIAKKPKTDDGVKFSARGLLRVEQERGEFVLHEDQATEQEGQGVLETMFEDGILVRREKFSDIRKRLWP